VTHRSIPILSGLLLVACWSPSVNKDSADAQVYSILDVASAQVTGEKRPFAVERPVDTLRQRLMTNRETIRLSLAEALDVAAENSRDFQRQKEQLYLSALNLTRSQHDFEFRFGGGVAATMNGQGDDTAGVDITPELSAAATSVVGTQVVANFVNTFLRSVINGRSFDGSSILNLTLTQPLLRGAGYDIAYESLTQAERDLTYEIRAFELFREEFTIRIAQQFFDLTSRKKTLAIEDANYDAAVFDLKKAV